MPVQVPIDYTMYMLVNKDLKMSPGKIASQVAHGIHHVVHNIFIDASTSTSTETKESFEKYNAWCVKPKIVSLYATQLEMDKYIDNSGHKCVFIRDAGKTQVLPNSLTIVCFHSSCTLSDEMKKYKLL